jgi:hypothetical protein
MAGQDRWARSFARRYQKARAEQAESELNALDAEWAEEMANRQAEREERIARRQTRRVREMLAVQ